MQINGLIDDLGLEQVRHTRVKDLTLSERRRLNAACHLLLETDIVVLDQPTRGMDIFDTFFLVEYLRQWAARGRIVVRVRGVAAPLQGGSLGSPNSVQELSLVRFRRGVTPFLDVR